MRQFCVIFLVIVSTVWCEKYTTKYDNIDVDEILSSDRLLKNYHNCLMDRGVCVPEAAELKKVLPDALQTNCEKCSDKQKEVTKKIVDYLMNNKKDMWGELSTKYDPEGIYFKKFSSEI